MHPVSDQMAKRFLSERQPLALNCRERNMTSQGNATSDAIPIRPHTKRRPVVGRLPLVIEDDKAVVYHCMDNSKEYLGKAILSIGI
jgi:hypothetical protein